MKAEYDAIPIEISEEMMGLLKEYAIYVMDAMRKAHPETDYCWNVCEISFDSLNPVFMYGMDVSDLVGSGEQNGYIVIHPEFLSAPKTETKKKSRKKK